MNVAIGDRPAGQRSRSRPRSRSRRVVVAASSQRGEHAQGALGEDVPRAVAGRRPDRTSPSHSTRRRARRTAAHREQHERQPRSRRGWRASAAGPGASDPDGDQHQQVAAERRELLARRRDHAQHAEERGDDLHLGRRAGAPAEVAGQVQRVRVARRPSTGSYGRVSRRRSSQNSPPATTKRDEHADDAGRPVDRCRRRR